MRYALILAGGSGTRLWPLSRASLPKQLAPIAGGSCLLAEAYLRLEGLVPEGRRFVCGGARHRAATVSALPGLARPSASGLPRYIGEPEGRDTLAALALSSALIASEDPDAVVAVFTSDHVIRPASELRAVVDRAFALAESSPGSLVTFGVEPDRPATGFGYLELGAELSGGAREVLRFREKPDAASAAEYLSLGPGRFLWNSGMFVWRASRFLELVERYAPETSRRVASLADVARGAGFADALAAVYPRLERVSVDYGIMEPASRDADVEIAAIPLGIEWLDVGSWPAYAELLPRDASGNATAGEVALVDSRANIVASFEEGHLVACLGCEGLVVVHCGDATLVCPRERADELKKLYARVAEIGGGRFT